MSPRTARDAVVLASGGLDSTTTLAVAASEGFRPHALTVWYGQRHAVELDAARAAARRWAVEHKVVELDLRTFGGSALTDRSLDVPLDVEPDVHRSVPVTYVPARNTIFLSLALAWAEVLPAADIFIGVNAVDFSGYPDCRPDFIAAFEQLANVATRAATEGGIAFRIHAPLISLTKRAIIERGLALGVDYASTVSCYDPEEDGTACGRCEACRLRLQGFADAGLSDPARYARVARTAGEP
jgi:7-cyano-7-deazaguanine synthase